MSCEQHHHYHQLQQQQKQQQQQKYQQQQQQQQHHCHHYQQHHHNYNHHQYQQHHLWFIIPVILFLIDISNSLTMTEVKIPNHIMRFKSAILGCRYNLDGEKLYSVKWYKDGHEFYRYVPRNKPAGQAFPLPGVNVDLRNSSDTQVMLRRVTLMSTGLYRCEVSGEAPAFNTVSESETMTVVVTPSHGPRISGGHRHYFIGDLVSVNCTSAPSKPACHLSWYINGEPASHSYLIHYDKLYIDRLEVSRLGLEFRVRSHHFHNGDMKLKCVAKISSLYWQSNEESLESAPQEKGPALESRDSVAAKSRATGASSANCRSLNTRHIYNMATLLSLVAFYSKSFSYYAQQR